MAIAVFFAEVADADLESRESAGFLEGGGFGADGLAVDGDVVDVGADEAVGGVEFEGLAEGVEQAVVTHVHLVSPYPADFVISDAERGGSHAVAEPLGQELGVGEALEDHFPGGAELAREDNLGVAGEFNLEFEFRHFAPGRGSRRVD